MDGEIVIRKSLVIWSGMLARLAEGLATADLQADKASSQESLLGVTL